MENLYGKVPALAQGTLSSKFASLFIYKIVSAKLASLRQSSKRSIHNLAHYELTANRSLDRYGFPYCEKKNSI